MRIASLLGIHPKIQIQIMIKQFFCCMLQFQKIMKLRLCAHGVAPHGFHNVSQNKNAINCQNSDRMKFSVFVQRRGLCRGAF